MAGSFALGGRPGFGFIGFEMTIGDREREFDDGEEEDVEGVEGEVGRYGGRRGLVGEGS